MRTVRILVLASMIVAAPACGEGNTDSATSGVRVAAAFYPLAWASDSIVGERGEVSDLTPPGAEPHDLELTSRDVEDVEDADLLVVLGGGFQPGLERLADRTESLVVADSISTKGPDGDPHLWLDPLAMIDVVQLLADRLAEIDPDGSETYRTNAKALEVRLRDLDTAFAAGLAECPRDLVVSAHDAFGWMTSRYGLRQEPIAGLSPDQEPDPRRLAMLSDLVAEQGVTTVFTETLVSPDVAEALAREAGVRTATLDPLESQPETGDYEVAMRANLAALRAALGCP